MTNEWGYPLVDEYGNPVAPYEPPPSPEINNPWRSTDWQAQEQFMYELQNQPAELPWGWWTGANQALDYWQPPERFGFSTWPMPTGERPEPQQMNPYSRFNDADWIQPGMEQADALFYDRTDRPYLFLPEQQEEHAKLALAKMGLPLELADVVPYTRELMGGPYGGVNFYGERATIRPTPSQNALIPLHELVGHEYEWLMTPEERLSFLQLAETYPPFWSAYAPAKSDSPYGPYTTSQLFGPQSDQGFHMVTPYFDQFAFMGIPPPPPILEFLQRMAPTIVQRAIDYGIYSPPVAGPVTPWMEGGRR